MQHRLTQRFARDVRRHELKSPVKQRILDTSRRIEQKDEPIASERYAKRWLLSIDFPLQVAVNIVETNLYNTKMKQKQQQKNTCCLTHMCNSGERCLRQKVLPQSMHFTSIYNIILHEKQRRKSRNKHYIGLCVVVVVALFFYERTNSVCGHIEHLNNFAPPLCFSHPLSM